MVGFFYRGVLVQWNCAVGVTRLFGISAREKNFCVHQRPMTTEARVLHWSSHLIRELVSTKESEKLGESSLRCLLNVWGFNQTNLRIVTFKVIEVGHILPFLGQDLIGTPALHHFLQSWLHLLTKKKSHELDVFFLKRRLKLTLDIIIKSLPKAWSSEFLN